MQKIAALGWVFRYLGYLLVAPSHPFPPVSRRFLLILKCWTTFFLVNPRKFLVRLVGRILYELQAPPHFCVRGMQMVVIASTPRL